MEDISWHTDKQMQFVRLYKGFQRLWNRKDKYYNNHQAKDAAWTAISKVLKTDTYVLKRRMKHMMSQFSREKARLKRAFKLDPKAPLPAPKWYLFKEMDFILAKLDPNLAKKFQEGADVKPISDEMLVHSSEGDDNKSNNSDDVVIRMPDNKFLPRKPVPPTPAAIINDREWRSGTLSDNPNIIPLEDNIIPHENKLIPLENNIIPLENKIIPLENKIILPKMVCKTDRNRAFVEYVYEVLKGLEVRRASNLRHSIQELLHNAEVEESLCLGPSYVKEDSS